MSFVLNLLRKFGGYIAAFLATIVFGYAYGRKSKSLDVEKEKQKETKDKALVEIAKSDLINQQRIEDMKAVNEIKTENSLADGNSIIDRLHNEYGRD